MLSVLLVEDDIDLAATVVDYLELEDIRCDHAANGVAGLNLLTSHRYDVLILDLNLPRLDGLSLCRQARELGVDVPVIMLTARDTLEDKVSGFEHGADDYLVKPFALEELTVRVKALAKRRSGQVSLLQVENLQLDLQSRAAKRGERGLKLSPTGLKILEVLMRASPQPVSREALLEAVWGDEQPDSNNLKVHIFNLRKAIDTDADIALLHTLAGVGFVLREQGTR